MRDLCLMHIIYNNHFRLIVSVVFHNLSDDDISMRRLSTVVLETNSTLATEAVGPEATEIDVGLGDVGVGDQEPETEDGLGENVKNSVGNDLSINGELARAIGDTPNTTTISFVC